MLHKLILEQREEFDKKVRELKNAEFISDETEVFDFGFRRIVDSLDVYTITDWGNIEKFILSSHLSIIDSEITRLEGELKEIKCHPTHIKSEGKNNPINVCSNCASNGGYNQAIHGEISYLKEQRAELLEGNK